MNDSATPTSTLAPVRFDPSVETEREDEAQTQIELVATLRDMA